MSLITVAYPESGLSGTISIVNIATEVEDFSGEITEIGTTKVYKYEFTEVAGESYVFTVTVPGYDDYVDSIIYEVSGSGGGLTTEEHTKLFSLENSTGGGGFSINYQAINSHTTKKINEIKEQIENLPNFEEKLNEISSHNSFATEEILNTIKESETEICSDIVRSKKEIKEDNVSTRQLVRQKTEKLDKNISKLSDRQDLTDKMIEDEADELEDQIDALYEKEADDLEKEIDDKLNEEFDQIESETNQLTNGNN